jgi:hypothetical protein
MRPQPLICVRDVEASSRWYQRLLGCQSDHGGPHYERLVLDGRLVLQLHHRDVEHHHGRIGDSNLTPGNGVLLWFEIGDFDGPLRVSPSCRRRSPSHAIAIRRTVTVVQTIGKSGCAIRMATRSCSPVSTVQQMEIGDRNEIYVAS